VDGAGDTGRADIGVDAGGADSSRGDGAAVDGRADVGAVDAGSGDARPTDAGESDSGTVGASVVATGSGVVEVFVNGLSLGKSPAAKALLTLHAAISAGSNAIVVRATSGSAATPFVQLQASGAFGKAGTSDRWKAKAAVGSEATDANGPWTAIGFDDSAWAGATDQKVAPVAPFPGDGPAHGIWTAASADATVLLRLTLYIPPDFNASKPTGFAKGVTGGLGGSTVTVTTPAELAQALGDDAPRIVQFAGLLDFTGSEGKTTASSCYQSQCADGTFEYITNGLGACTSANKPTFDVTFDKAGTTGLPVGSNKTLIGIGPGATIKGKGLKISNNASNIIVRNLTITTINPEIVWGGDAIDLDGASNVWIDHVRVSLVGRQFFVSGYGPSANVTLSWNEFDGRTSWSATCNGAHYWTFLVLGSNDTITMSNNWIHHTSGRGPHAGGPAGATQVMQFANDLYEIVPGHAANPATGSSLLYEGTVFLQVTRPIQLEAADAGAGAIYAPLATTVGSTNTACMASLGRVCVANIATPQNGTFPLDSAALTAFSSRRASLVVPYAAAGVLEAVPHLAGPGHI
jgi:pectin lyase